jgi:hypothetical protein
MEGGMSIENNTTSAVICKLIDDEDAATLPDIANEIADHCTYLHATREDKLGRTIRIGQLLLHVKVLLPHGQLTPWVRDNVPFGPRQASKYLYVYKHRAHALEAEKKNPWFRFAALNDMVKALRDWLDKHNVKKGRRRKHKGRRRGPKLFMDPADPDGSAYRVYAHEAARSLLWQLAFQTEFNRLVAEQPDIDREGAIEDEQPPLDDG